MRKGIGHLIAAACSAGIMWSLAACCRNEEAQVSANGGMATLSVGFKIPARAAEGYEDGSADENSIDIARGNYRIYFFDTENRFIARFDPAGFFADDGGDYRQYSVMGKVPDALVEHSSFKMVVIANWPKYPEDADVEEAPKEGVTTIADICNAKWATYDCLTDDSKTQAAGLDPSSGKIMPFYGVREYSNVVFKTEALTTLDNPVTLLRAMAKVEVIIDTGNDISVTYAKIVGYNKSGYCAPANVYSQSDYGQGSNWQTDYLSELHLIGGQNDEDATTRSLSLFRENRGDGSTAERWSAYLPEYRNIGAGDEYACLELKFNFQADSDNPYRIYFAEYGDNGKADNSRDDLRLDIERNNIYRFNVKVSPLLLLVSVEKWEFGGKVHIDM